ncbi:hypothetical protein ISF_01906 [Cordyceps fumosorosea ARSEF 2679]|uniref:Uncharacterized protein n=1 Tax=Cordyceps fumosorosea (strain ARSEF 2679) TaxID=1081104 RepID=A0A168CGR6_CORFA|nr:hypothetical protein ISF_01906 [Cordyceps fumosorosea ARSEF 2679]OAA71355.1 hypothetical protein ISF_01906 [Cordyceps fumosorosea ARSEF 2679]
MDHFVNFFRIKAGIDWQDRVLREGTTPLSLFQYSPPTGGKPVGRRLRFSYDHCVELNLEWKRRNLPQEIDHEIENRDAEEVDGSAEDDDGDSIGDDEEGGIAIDIDEEFREVSPGAAQAIEESDEPKSKPPTSESICISPGEESTEASGDERAEPSPGPLDPPRQL